MSTGGETRTTIRLKQIRGGAYTGGGSCELCNMDYNRAYGDSFGSSEPVDIGTTHGLYRDSTTVLGLSASVGGASLGVTRITGTSSSVTYFADTANIVIYDFNTNGRIYHMTAQR